MLFLFIFLLLCNMPEYGTELSNMEMQWIFAFSFCFTPLFTFGFTFSTIFITTYSFLIVSLQFSMYLLCFLQIVIVLYIYSKQLSFITFSYSKAITITSKELCSKIMTIVGIIILSNEKHHTISERGCHIVYGLWMKGKFEINQLIRVQ